MLFTRDYKKTKCITSERGGRLVLLGMFFLSSFVARAQQEFIEVDLDTQSEYIQVDPATWLGVVAADPAVQPEPAEEGEFEKQFQPLKRDFWEIWILDRAEAKERPVNSKQDYEKRVVTADDFLTNYHFFGVPVEMTVFHGGYTAHVRHPSWSKFVLCVINTENNDLLEFRDYQENVADDVEATPALSNISSYRVIKPAYSVTLSGRGKVMTLQGNYTYLDAFPPKGKDIEGIITLYYKQR